jgi:ABC-2 type transport system ATP-binding protein
MTVALKTENLGKVYRVGFFMRRVEALKNLNLEVKPGEAFGFIGPNGAGKTTAIKILMGLHRQTSGSAHLFGESVDNVNARRRVGYLPERPYFYVHLSAREVLHFYGQLFEMDPKVRTRRIEMLLERVQLTRFADVTLSKYSKGMLQRVGLCQSLLHDPDLIVLDEPMSGLDPVGRALVRDLIIEQRESGKTVFFSSHILSDVEAICDRVAILVGGELRESGSIEDVVRDRESLEAVLVGEMTKSVDESKLGVL